MCLVDILDAIYSIVRAFKGCIPTAKHYLGKLPEDYKAPCFLYEIAFSGNNRETKYTKDSSIDLQIIYFGIKDGYGGMSYEDNLKVMGQLRQFLDTFLLQVGDRWLKFNYNFDEVDDQLIVNMDFKFKDSVINSEDVYSMIEQIFINGKEV